jgi:GNAT superfamily N-acetyltransferase
LAEFLIRQARIDDCSAMARILISATQNAFRGRVPDRCLEWITPEESAANWAKYLKSEERLAGEDFLFVVETQPYGVIGLALLGKRSDSDDSHELNVFSWELRTLQVDPAWQRQGIGRRLVSRVAEQVWQEGARHLLVRVLAENPNRAFYERLGARRLGTQPNDWEGYQTEEILYGWDDINGLRDAA